MLVAVGALVLIVALARNHAPAEAGALGVLLVISVVEGRFLLADLRRHPANFPDPTLSHGLR
jgi:hypothetical protein